MSRTVAVLIVLAVATFAAAWYLAPTSSLGPARTTECEASHRTVHVAVDDFVRREHRQPTSVGDLVGVTLSRTPKYWKVLDDGRATIVAIDPSHLPSECRKLDPSLDH